MSVESLSPDSARGTDCSYGSRPSAPRSQHAVLPACHTIRASVARSGLAVTSSSLMARVDVILIAGKEAVDQPWLWRLSRDFNVQVNIRKASVDTDYGWIQVELEGAVEEIQRATAWLMTTGMHVEAAERALGAS